MSKRKCFYAVMLMLAFSILMLTGCGKGASKEAKKEEDGVVVALPEGSKVESVFHFESKETMGVHGATSFGIPDGMVLYIGTLEDGNSVVWYSDSVFLYLPGEANTTNIIYYAKRLKEDPIAYDEFEKQYK